MLHIRPFYRGYRGRLSIPVQRAPGANRVIGPRASRDAILRPPASRGTLSDFLEFPGESVARLSPPQDRVSTPTPGSHGPSTVPPRSNLRSSAWISCHTASFCAASGLDSIWCNALNEACSKRTHSAADALCCGAATVWLVTSRNPAWRNAASRTPAPPRLKGAGWPGSGGGSFAWRRMIDMRIEMNGLRSGTGNCLIRPTANLQRTLSPPAAGAPGRTAAFRATHPGPAHR